MDRGLVRFGLRFYGLNLDTLVPDLRLTGEQW
jgi:hypothetical protein